MIVSVAESTSGYRMCAVPAMTPSGHHGSGLIQFYLYIVQERYVVAMGPNHTILKTIQ